MTFAQALARARKAYRRGRYPDRLKRPLRAHMGCRNKSEWASYRLGTYHHQRDSRTPALKPEASGMTVTPARTRQ